MGIAFSNRVRELHQSGTVSKFTLAFFQTLVEKVPPASVEQGPFAYTRSQFTHLSMGFGSLYVRSSRHRSWHSVPFPAHFRICRNGTSDTQRTYDIPCTHVSLHFDAHKQRVIQWFLQSQGTCQTLTRSYCSKLLRNTNGRIWVACNKWFNKDISCIIPEQT